MSGIDTSSRIRSTPGGSLALSKADAPSFASSTRHSGCRSSASMARLILSSSTIRTVCRAYSSMGTFPRCSRQEVNTKPLQCDRGRIEFEVLVVHARLFDELRDRGAEQTGAKLLE